MVHTKNDQFVASLLPICCRAKLSCASPTASHTPETVMDSEVRESASPLGNGNDYSLVMSSNSFRLRCFASEPTSDSESSSPKPGFQEKPYSFAYKTMHNPCISSSFSRQPSPEESLSELGARTSSAWSLCMDRYGNFGCKQ